MITRWLFWSFSRRFWAFVFFFLGGHKTYHSWFTVCHPMRVSINFNLPWECILCELNNLQQHFCLMHINSILKFINAQLDPMKLKVSSLPVNVPRRSKGFENSKHTLRLLLLTWSFLSSKRVPFMMALSILVINLSILLNLNVSAYAFLFRLVP